MLFCLDEKTVLGNGNHATIRRPASRFLIGVNTHKRRTVMVEKSLHRRKREAEKKIALIDGERMYHLVCFGDHLAKKMKYKEHDGMDAIHFYLIEKYHWLPYQARSLNHDDLRFLLAEEMHTWTLAKEDHV
jgi:hypothetical protein